MITDIIKSIRTLEITTNRQVDHLFSGQYKSAFKGRGLEFSGLRQYTPGDDVRYIDWRTSARKSDLYVKQFQESREVSMIFLIDVSGSMFFGSQGQSKLDLLLQVVATLSLSALKNSDRIGALFFQEDVRQSLPPRKGRGYFWQILHSIYRFGADMIYHQSNPLSALQHLHRVSKRRSIVFLLTDELDLSDPELKKWLQITNAKHDFVVGRITDPAEQNFPLEGTFYLEDPETGERELVDFSRKSARDRFAKIRQKQERNQSESLKKMGIDHLHFDNPHKVFSLLNGFFRQRQKRY